MSSHTSLTFVTMQHLGEKLKRRWAGTLSFLSHGNTLKWTRVNAITEKISQRSKSCKHSLHARQSLKFIQLFTRGLHQINRNKDISVNGSIWKKNEVVFRLHPSALGVCWWYQSVEAIMTLSERIQRRPGVNGLRFVTIVAPWVRQEFGGHLAAFFYASSRVLFNNYFMINLFAPKILTFSRSLYLTKNHE